MEILGYLASFLMGVTLGLLGGGGSILTVPILVYLFGFSPSVATGNSLLVVGLSALLGSILYIRKGNVNFKVGIFFAVPSVIGVSVSRALILPRIPQIIFSLSGFSLTKDILIMATFSVFMIAASYSMIKKKVEPKPIEVRPVIRLNRIAFQGLIVGLVAGFVGAGGGFLIIPALVLLAGLGMKVAIGTSLMIIALQSLLGFMGDVVRGATVDWSPLGIIVIIAALGIIVGSMLVHKIKEQKLKMAFGWFVFFMGSIILIEQLYRL